ncbi:MAG: recombination protein RmuC [Betaproteobacteria bacterium]|jgi:DNA recombination protein RmuC|nr:recombination protein RmuC [Betaproteobacteria bacterium]
MVEILLVLTLLVAASTAGLLALFLMRARSAEREAREELSRGLATFSQTLTNQMGSTATVQNAQFETLRGAVEQQLGRIQQDNAAKLEQMRQTVDEKLHATLEKRLSESFKQVSDRLELVHKGLGEMQTLAAGVGDLKRVLSNVKTRGVFGEAQLAALLEQVMAPEQYEKNVATRPGSRERVEFAIKLPGNGGNPVLLPIDAKFPLEDYQRLQAAQEAGDLLAAELAGKALEARVKLEARSIAEKYVEPPNTTDFALLYLPFEGLFAEVLRRPGLFDHIQREWRVTICGPTNLLAYLNSLQMGFRTLAIQQRSSEVWKVLGTVKSEFGRFAEVLANTKRQLQTVANTIDQAEVRTRQIERKLKDVEVVPGAEAVQEDLQLEEKPIAAIRPVVK